MTRGQICFLNEYCTNCPIRKNCTVRPIFYSEEEYQAWKDLSFANMKALLNGLNINPNFISSGADLGFDMMDKRRAKELELHPTYSKE